MRRSSRVPGPSLEIDERAVRVRGVPVRLTHTEREVLLRLDRAGAAGLPRAAFLDLVTAANPEHALDDHLTRIRKKLGDAARCLKAGEGRYRIDFDAR